MLSMNFMQETPQQAGFDNGPEFISQTLLLWTQENGIERFVMKY